LISNILGIQGTFLEGKVNFEDGELSFDDDSVETFFFGFIFISDRDSLEKIELMESDDSVSEDLSDLACGLGGIA